MVLYMLCEADEYELPVCVGETLAELAKLSGYCRSTLYMALTRKSVIEKKYKVEKICTQFPKCVVL